MVRNAHQFQLCLGTQKKLLMLTKQSSLRLTHDTKVVCINDDERALPILKLSKHWDVTNSQNQNDVGSDGKVKGSTNQKAAWRAPSPAEVRTTTTITVLSHVADSHTATVTDVWCIAESHTTAVTPVHLIAHGRWYRMGDTGTYSECQHWVTCDEYACTIQMWHLCFTGTHKVQSSIVMLRRYWTAMISYTIDK